MNDLTTREVFDKLVQTQDKLVDVQRDTAKALQNMSASIDGLSDELKILQTKESCVIAKHYKWIIALALGGWVMAALALGVKGLDTILQLFGVS